MNESEDQPTASEAESESNLSIQPIVSEPEQPVQSETESEKNVPVKPPMSPNPQNQPQQSKLDSLPREDLMKLLKKQVLTTKESKKQSEELKQQISTLEEKCKKLEDESNKDDKTEMITLELNDYKSSCTELKKQIEIQAENQKKNDELIRELSAKNDQLMQDKAEIESTLKQAKSDINKLQKELNEQKTLMSENSKETQSLSLQSQQLKAEHELELSKLNGQLKRARDELAEQQKYVTEKTTEIRKYKSDMDNLQRRFDEIQVEYSTFKERAEYVLKQKNMDRTESSQSSNNKHEIDELIKTIQARNDKISQLNERCSFLEDELQSNKEYAKNLKSELEDAHSTLNLLKTKGSEERRRTESDFEFKLRQALTDNEILQKKLNRTIEQYSLEKEKLIDSFQRQNSELESENKELKSRIDELKELALQPRNPTPNPSVINTPVKDTVQRRIQSQISRVQPINFNQTSSYSTSMMENQPGLDHDNEDDDLKSLQDVINGAMESDFNSSVGRPITSLDEVCSRPSVDFVSYEEYDALEKQLDHTRDLLNDMEDTNAKLLEQIKILKEEIRRLERNTERQEHVKNSEYLKNVVMKFLAPPKVHDERQQLLPVLTTILRLSPDEVTNITKFIKESSLNPEEQSNAGGWGSFFSGYV